MEEDKKLSTFQKRPLWKKHDLIFDIEDDSNGQASTGEYDYKSQTIMKQKREKLEEDAGGSNRSIGASSPKQEKHTSSHKSTEQKESFFQPEQQ